MIFYNKVMSLISTFWNISNHFRDLHHALGLLYIQAKVMGTVHIFIKNTTQDDLLWNVSNSSFCSIAVSLWVS